MGGARRSVNLFIACLLALLLGCSTGGTIGGSSGGTSTGGGAGSPSPAGASTPAGAGAGGGGSISSIDACALLTPNEIEGAFGALMKAGVKAPVSGNSAGCAWKPQADTAGLEIDVTITPFDQSLWDSETKVSGAEGVAGIGDAAFRGFLGPGVLLIKKGDMEVDLLVISVFLDQQEMKTGQVSLAKLLISRL